jgi:hypothetical protein
MLLRHRSSHLRQRYGFLGTRSRICECRSRKGGWHSRLLGATLRLSPRHHRILARPVRLRASAPRLRDDR